MLTIAFDEKLGILRSVSAGFTSDDEVEAFIRRSAELIKVARARRGHVLHLVEASETPVQSQTAMARLASSAAAVFQPGDRTAVIMHSALAIMQSRRLPSQGAMEKFGSEDEALAWLLGEEYRPSAA